MKALVIAHGHPDFNVGGGELAAYDLFCAIRRRKEVTSATFLGRTDNKHMRHGSIMLRRAGEYLWRQDMGEWFRLRTANFTSIVSSFREFLLFVKPDIIFMHHFVHMGIEALMEIKKTLPNCRLVLTLHEYTAICHQSGQMVKKQNKKLCYRESFDDCSACFPDFSGTDFWLRKHYIQRHFEAVNTFVSPSMFLRNRFIEWGIPEEHIFVIENGQADQIVNQSYQANLFSTFGFFGQITAFKGVDVFLQAIHLLPKDIRAKCRFEVHGANLESQEAWLQELIGTLRKPLIEEGVLRWVGPYERSELPGRMKRIGWVIVPSIWWENSPMVIQESFVNQRPVICSGIGGMAEKVRDRVDGFHFEVKNPMHLAEVLTEASRDFNVWVKMVKNIKAPINYDQCAYEYMKLAMRK
ncbi:glycosyltransferase [Roseixanthobacter liquoris]|uniref:glycosyltransferase n=1 Tax=Roseixanthobacter liquoris TaxID=3119921 RepID=UPI0037272FCF